jgi:uncharacterized protein (DUF2141 family)
MNRALALLLPAAAGLVAAAAAPAPGVEVRIEKLRSERGLVHLCLTARPATFPDCAKDGEAITRTVPARGGGPVSFGGLAPGEYALAIFHDENGNKKLDTFLGIPREGFGFSRNPAVRFGAPKFGQARFEVSGGIALVTIRMQYLL